MPEDKSLKSYKAGMRAAKKPGKHRRKDVVHLIPDLFLVGAAAEPFVGNSGSGVSTLDTLSPSWNPGESLSQRMSGAFDNLITNMKGPGSTLIPAAELAVVGLVAKWLGKSTGLNRIGTKKVKIL